MTQETVASGMVSTGAGQVAPTDAITLVALVPCDVPGYGTYRAGDIFSVEERVAKVLLAVGREDQRERVVKKYKEGTSIPEAQRARGRT